MKVHQGFDRIVILIGIFAIKIPNFIDAFNHQDKRPLWRGILRKIWKNWQEFMFYLKHRHPFCVPTYFSLFGLFNIQRRTPNLPKHLEIVFWDGIISVTNDQFRELGFSGHTLTQQMNFGIYKGQCVIRDYTKLRDQRFILEFGEKLQKYLDQVNQTTE